jgi:poly(A) polymerase
MQRAGFGKAMNTATLTYLPQLLSLTPDTIYLVGGSVRDLLITNQLFKDIDLMMPAGSESVARSFAAKINGSFFFLDEDRRITRVIKKTDDAVLQFDFTNFEGPDLFADLGRRDFTMNAMALELREFLRTGALDNVIDLFGGREDVRNKVIRLTKPEVLDDDPLRSLRAVRFAAALGFTIDAGTQEQIRSRAALVSRSAPERIRDEFFQVLSQRGAHAYLSLLDSLGLLPQLLPELEALRGFAPGRYHVHDVRTHSIKATGHVDGVLKDLPNIAPDHADRILAHLDELLEQLVPRKAALRFACLLHDIAKPETFAEENGHIHFYHHDGIGAAKAKETCRRFRLSRDTEELVTGVIRQHMRLFNLSTPGGPSRNALYRYCRDMGDGMPESLILAQADARATFDIMPKELFTDTERPMGTVLSYYYEKFLKAEAKPLVTGRDLIARGFAPGPRFREILDDIREQQAAGMIQDRKDALEHLGKIRS